MTLPSGSLNQTDFMSSPIMEATPCVPLQTLRFECHERDALLTQRADFVIERRQRNIEATAVALLVPAYSD